MLSFDTHAPIVVPGTTKPWRESEIEQALVDHIQHFLLEPGIEASTSSRQELLEVGIRNYYVDFLFYYLKLRCYAVVEPKAVTFGPAFAGQMNLCLSAVDDLSCHPVNEPNIDSLLRKSAGRPQPRLHLLHLPTSLLKATE